jgi:hypothetical protein
MTGYGPQRDHLRGRVATAATTRREAGGSSADLTPQVVSFESGRRSAPQRTPRAIRLWRPDGATPGDEVGRMARVAVAVHDERRPSGDEGLARSRKRGLAPGGAAGYSSRWARRAEHSAARPQQSHQAAYDQQRTETTIATPALLDPPGGRDGRRSWPAAKALSRRRSRLRGSATRTHWVDHAGGHRHNLSMKKNLSEGSRWGHPGLAAIFP